MEKVILYYNFVKVDDPQTMMRWQRELCARLGLTGRIIVAEQGINGTLGGNLKNLKYYVREMRQHPLFADTQFKWSEGGAADFPRLSVKVRDELVTLSPDEKFDVFNSTQGLSPKQWHEYIEQNPDVIILDARNDYESDIGAFKGKNVIKPQISAFREIKEHLEELPKDKTILTYCTGDVRCEYLSAYMTHKGFKDVKHLEGGIVKYGQKYGDSGHWVGKCFVFDRRLNVAFSEDAKDIGACVHCSEETSRHVNCQNKQCNGLALVCENCSDMVACKEECAKFANEQMAKQPA